MNPNARNGLTEDKIREFQGEYRWLSNFWPAEVHLEGVAYPSVENAYQAAKFPAAERSPFRTCRAAIAKGRGRYGQNLENKVDLMYRLVKEKFQNPALRAKLLATGTRLIEEGNLWHDSFWGVDLHTRLGENNLGKIIMRIREEQL